MSIWMDFLSAIIGLDWMKAKTNSKHSRQVS